MATLTAKQEPYPVYKPSGVEWLGEIPVHWDVKRLKYLATVNDETLPENTDPNEEITYVDIGNVDSVKGITGAEDLIFENAPSRARRIVRQGDVIISTVRTYLKAIARIESTNTNFVVSTGFAVIRPRQLDDGFTSYALGSPYFVERVVAHSVGVSYPAINASELAWLDIAFPPLPEQRAIASFLDRETAKIDALVSKKERLIELLQEKRTAFINHTVTKGLDRGAPMKDSGIEWLGEIPANWEVKRLRVSVTDYVGGVWGSEPNGLNDLPCVRVADFDRIRLRVYMNNPTMRAIAPNHRRQRVLSPGDLLLEKSGGGDLQPVGAVMLYDFDTPAVCSNFIARLRIAVEYDPVFLTYFHFALYAIRLNTKSIKQTTGIQNLDTSAYLNELVCFPPLADQNAIAAFLDRETTKLDSLIATVREAIRLLRELRTALISAAVTGKIDVREDKECT